MLEACLVVMSGAELESFSAYHRNLPRRLSFDAAICAGGTQTSPTFPVPGGRLRLPPAEAPAPPAALRRVSAPPVPHTLNAALLKNGTVGGSDGIPVNRRNTTVKTRPSRHERMMEYRQARDAERTLEGATAVD